MSENAIPTAFGYVRFGRGSRVRVRRAAYPYAEANADDSGAGAKQRNGRKSLTTVQGLKKEYSYSKILKDLKKEFCSNGTVFQDPQLGQAGILKKENIEIHGF